MDRILPPGASTVLEARRLNQTLWRCVYYCNYVSLLTVLVLFASGGQKEVIADFEEICLSSWSHICEPREERWREVRRHKEKQGFFTLSVPVIILVSTRGPRTLHRNSSFTFSGKGICIFSWMNLSECLSLLLPLCARDAHTHQVDAVYVQSNLFLLYKQARRFTARMQNRRGTYIVPQKSWYLRSAKP